MVLHPVLHATRARPMIDSHAHLYFDRFDADREEVIERAHEAGITAIINIGIDAATSRAAIDLAGRHPSLFATVGIHPTSPVAELGSALAEIRDLATEHDDRVVGIGEIGLDYYWKDVSPSDQGPKLRGQLALARELDRPIVVHCRDALDDLLDLLETERPLPPGVLHCFCGTPTEAQRALDMGFHISFAGNVTFKKSTDLRESARAVPPGRLLLETDAPFLAPQARRGRRNEPAFLPFTCEVLAELHGMGATELAELTHVTTRRLFGI